MADTTIPIILLWADTVKYTEQEDNLDDLKDLGLSILKNYPAIISGMKISCKFERRKFSKLFTPMFILSSAIPSNLEKMTSYLTVSLKLGRLTWMYIFGYLSLNDKKQMRLVCREANQLMNTKIRIFAEPFSLRSKKIDVKHWLWKP
jgi:hypothetical protein